MGTSKEAIQPKAYRLRQVADLLSIPYSTAWDLVRRGELPSVQIGDGARKITLIPADALDELLAPSSAGKRQRSRG